MSPDLCRAFVDKKGLVLDLARYKKSDFDALLEMYLEFSPKPASQGLPPPDREGCVRWVKGLCEASEGFLAWVQNKIVGHSALIADLEKQDGEFLIFVDQDFRNRGIGTQLTCMALDRAKEMSLKAVWLTVERFNFRAIALYKRFGFQFCDEDDWERAMRIEL